MKKTFVLYLFLAAILGFEYSTPAGVRQTSPFLQFDFEGNVKSRTVSFTGKNFTFNEGVDGQALRLTPESGYNVLSLNNVKLDGSDDFSVQFWIKTTSKNPTVFLSQKDLKNKGITAQKNAGWALYSSGGTFAWCVGSGTRRINYERDNGDKMPISDGKWHQLTLTYSKELAQFRLYYDGRNVAVYHVGFDFFNDAPLLIGAVKNDFDYEKRILPEIEAGAEGLQKMVDEFNQLGLDHLKNDELFELITDPGGILEKRLAGKSEAEKEQFGKRFEGVLVARKKLMPNPYTVYQNAKLTRLKPVSKIYSLKNGKIRINESVARKFTLNEKLFPADFAMDQLTIWDRSLSPAEVRQSYSNYRTAPPFNLEKSLNELIVGDWNIWHGGKHRETQRDNGDSRLCISEILKKYHVDVILMQETYSSGDFIAAELGYYFATTSDWDYCYQGANISVISRFPIEELWVSKETEFNNVAVKLAISQSQKIYAMSNWYGMNNFPKVVAFHQSRFDDADNIPVIFGGDFNAVPHTDGGNSPASKKLLEEGFTDAYRSLYSDVERYPGFTHRSGARIDQIYYKGKCLKNVSTKIISDWPTGFPSDHYLIVTKFELLDSSGQ